jgi:Insertion element 4 transposase N-terminal
MVSPVAGTPGGTVVLRAADLLIRGGGTVTAGGIAPSAGDLAVFCRPVVTAPAVVRRDGTVLAGAWLPDLVRLGELERHLGDGVIEAIAGKALEAGRPKRRERRRLMSCPLVIRLMIAMTLMPDASYCESLARLAGVLADVPFALQWHVPTEKVVTGWRLPVPASVMEEVFRAAAGPLIADDEPPAVLLAGMMVLAAGGMLVNLPDTPANRAMFGSTGTADGSAPFPQLRIVAITARAGRAMPGAIPGGSSAGEQTLLKRLVRRRPDLVAGRVTCFDRNFPGHDLITAIVDAGGHVIARMRAGIALPLEPGGGWLPDGSRLTWLNAPSGKKADRLPVRAAEHNVILPCGDGGAVSETCTLITTLLDHQAAPADAVRNTYLTRRSASETTFGEDKATITGAGNRTAGPVLRSGRPRLVIQEARAWLTATQLVRASAAAALRSHAAAARRLRRDDSAPVTADEESFTAIWRHAIRSMTSSHVTASSSLNALAAAADAAARAALHTLNIAGRERHSERTQKTRPKFPHTSGTKQTVTGKPQVTVFAPSRTLTAAGQQTRQEGETAPASRDREPRNRAPPPPRHAGQSHTPNLAVPSPEQTQRTDMEHQGHNTPERCKRPKSVVLGDEVADCDARSCR